MKVITNNKLIAIEVLSAQNLFNEDINKIKIDGYSSVKYGLNDYDAEVTIEGMNFILYRDANFKNVDIKTILKSNIQKIEWDIISKW